MGINLSGGKRTSSTGLAQALNVQGQRTTSSGVPAKLKGGKS